MLPPPTAHRIATLRDAFVAGLTIDVTGSSSVSLKAMPGYLLSVLNHQTLLDQVHAHREAGSAIGHVAFGWMRRETASLVCNRADAN